MEVWVAILGGSMGAAIVSAVNGIILWKLNHKAAKDDRACNIMAGVQILLYDRIKHLGKVYIEAGSICVEDLEDIIAMHKIYHDDLEGNGFLDNLICQVKKLPIRPVAKG